MKQRGRQRVGFEITVSDFNNSDFKLLVSLRLDNPEDPNRTDMIAFTNDDNSCFFAVRNNRNKTYALLSDRALQFKMIQ